VSDTDATEQRVKGFVVAAEDLEICRHADGKPWLLGSGGVLPCIIPVHPL
jgi:hypothetical protein